ncbi:DUF1857-domain-containing protein [Mycena galericulata]|nr:DUF1857-domain-containing protein [Mycena galericulata]
MAYAFAVTRPVNPAGATTILTEAQIWKGMEYKARNPKPFLPNFQSSKTISDTGNKFVLESTVELPVMGSIVLKEDIELHAPTMVYFETSLGGLRVTNIISYGPAEELLLTWAFANGIPGIPADKPKPSAKELNERMGTAVEKSLEIVRQLVKEGKI